MFTDRAAGTIRRLRPVLVSGEPDASRPVLFSGQTQLLTPGGVLPLGFEIEAASLEEAIAKFPQAVQEALNQAIEEAREMRREAQSRIVVPEAGGMGGLPGGARGGASKFSQRRLRARETRTHRGRHAWGHPWRRACLVRGRRHCDAGRRCDDKRLRNADREPGQWLAAAAARTTSSATARSRASTPNNVSRLGLAWYYDLDTNRGQEASPIVIDGALYVTSAWSKVFAFNAKTGKLLWKYDPKVPGQTGIKGCCDVVNRGVAAWQGRIYLGAYDGRLIALDAKSGKEVWSVQTTDASKYYTITGAPRIANGKVIIGNGGSEIGVRGYISAFDAQDGKLLWRFYTIPGDPSKPYENEACVKRAAATWTGDLYWKLGGGTAWDGIVYEPTTNLRVLRHGQWHALGGRGAQPAAVATTCSPIPSSR